MSKQPILLGVNIDHVATLRQARGVNYPSPIQAALIAERAGADGITAHLREDRRHIQDSDIEQLQQQLNIPLNLEMAITPEMLTIATQIKPVKCCLVPEKRAELTTEGGLDIIANSKQVKTACQLLADADIEVSLFIDPDFKQIDAAVIAGVPVIELHTGCYANVKHKQKKIELTRITQAAQYAQQAGLQVNAGHGLHFYNVSDICKIPQIVALNVGHAIIAESVFLGLSRTVKQFKKIILAASI